MFPQKPLIEILHISDHICVCMYTYVYTYMYVYVCVYPPISTATQRTILKLADLKQ